MKLSKKRLMEMAGLNESFEEEVANLVSRQAGKVMSMRQEADKAAFNLLDQSLESLVSVFMQNGYDSDAVHAFFASLVRDAIELEQERAHPKNKHLGDNR